MSKQLVVPAPKQSDAVANFAGVVTGRIRSLLTFPLDRPSGVKNEGKGRVVSWCKKGPLEAFGARTAGE